MSAFFTWANLATIAGATAATAYIVQFLKKFSIFSKANSQAVSYGVALIILFLATYFTGALTVSAGIMVLFNAVIVAFSSNGAYDSVKATVSEIVSGSAGTTSVAHTVDSSAAKADTASSSTATAAQTSTDTASTASVAQAASTAASGAVASGTAGAV